ncbi:hypothetical protein L0B53_06525 [Vibrio sp. SS-MA-C1-2]|uniref:hypothetical protein n=1 Tax=Vibrio sp. SS-MA-C1-2 TaxID=2908646 RepID=UPI001F410D83|nr:hypothetical protein [Vibrio sp. SS-MA-C1-2]UJF19224.1 hypothetical protein L0B53_06525 [Vibrio sp. SS-MA-C1-2]
MVNRLDSLGSAYYLKLQHAFIVAKKQLLTAFQAWLQLKRLYRVFILLFFYLLLSLVFIWLWLSPVFLERQQLKQQISRQQDQQILTEKMVRLTQQINEKYQDIDVIELGLIVNERQNLISSTIQMMMTQYDLVVVELGWLNCKANNDLFQQCNLQLSLSGKYLDLNHFMTELSQYLSENSGLSIIELSLVPNRFGDIHFKVTLSLMARLPDKKVEQNSSPSILSDLEIKQKYTFLDTLNKQLFEYQELKVKIDAKMAIDIGEDHFKVINNPFLFYPARNIEDMSNLGDFMESQNNAVMNKANSTEVCQSILIPEGWQYRGFIHFSAQNYAYLTHDEQGAYWLKRQDKLPLTEWQLSELNKNRLIFKFQQSCLQPQILYRAGFYQNEIDINSRDKKEGETKESSKNRSDKERLK